MRPNLLKPALKWASLLAGLAALWLSYGQIGAPYITNDGYQYLDAASNLASGQCFCTRVALFDEQVAFGRMPIPFTHFAPLYPVLIAIVSRTGIRLETAGYLLSAFGFLAVIWLMYDIGFGLGVKPWIVACFSVLWITHASALLYASTVGTESLFAMLLLSLAALIVRDVRSEGNNAVLSVLIGAVAGLSYGIRYPGIFLVGSAVVYLLARLWRTPRARWGAIAGIAVATVLIGFVQVRNAIYTGSWRGGFQNSGHQTLPGVVLDVSRVLLHLVVGDRVPMHLDLPIIALGLSVGLLLFVVVLSWRNLNHPASDIREALIWMLFIGLGYVGGVLLAALTTIANALPRYLLPVYPLFLICAAVVCSAVAKGPKSIAVALLVLSTVVVESRNLLVEPPRPDWILARAVLAEDTYPGLPLLEWLRDRIGPDDVIVAVAGQAVHYLLQRPVVAVIPPDLTNRMTDETGYRSLMSGYRSRYLMILEDAPWAPEQTSTSFLRTLAVGNSPTWLKVAVRTPHAVIYECEVCVK